MERLIKDGVVMEVSEDIAPIFKSNGYVEKAEESAPPQSIVEKEREELPTDYTKSEILRMKTEDLKVLATELGLEVTEESTGKALKEDIIAKLDL